MTAGNYFPPEYKSFPFKEGDTLAFPSKGKYAILRILKIDRIDVAKDASINIQGKSFTATEDDFLLVVSTSFSNADFGSIDEARRAVEDRSWQISIGHVPRRPSGVGKDAVLLANQPVTDSELQGYREWKTAFERGDASVF